MSCCASFATNSESAAARLLFTAAVAKQIAFLSVFAVAPSTTPFDVSAASYAPIPTRFFSYHSRSSPVIPSPFSPIRPVSAINLLPAYIFVSPV